MGDCYCRNLRIIEDGRHRYARGRGRMSLSAPGRGKDRRGARLFHRCPCGCTRSAIADARCTSLSKLFSERSADNAITRAREYGESRPKPSMWRIALRGIRPTGLVELGRNRPSGRIPPNGSVVNGTVSFGALRFANAPYDCALRALKTQSNSREQHSVRKKINVASKTWDGPC